MSVFIHLYHCVPAGSGNLTDKIGIYTIFLLIELYLMVKAIRKGPAVTEEKGGALNAV